MTYALASPFPFELKFFEQSMKAYMQGKSARGVRDHGLYQNAEDAIRALVIAEEGSSFVPAETVVSVAPYLFQSETLGIISSRKKALATAIQALLDRTDIDSCNLTEEIAKIRPLAKSLIEAVRAHQPPSSCCKIL